MAKTSAMGPLMARPENGVTPLVTPLAKLTMSGCTPQWSTAPPLTGASEPGHRLVADHQDVVAVAQGTDAFEVAVRWHDGCRARTRDRLEEHRGDVLGSSGDERRPRSVAVRRRPPREAERPGADVGIRRLGDGVVVEDVLERLVASATPTDPRAPSVEP